ncbi:BadF/BadG/BcrA/BcrD ATPase family protein [Tumebacillus sp. BK434]|nr:BadF/BadG/BcrA/BcrD ATPase family protein [Tumebacillus sp. BK434]
MREWILEQWPGAFVGVENDTLPALVGGSGETEGIVLIGGTGSIAFGINDRGEKCRVGGWGYLIGDEGSGYNIGKDAYSAVLKSFDGRGPQTLLTGKILAYYGLQDPTALIPLVYSNGFTREQVAAVTRFVFEAAREGDEVSLTLLSRAADELGELVRTMLTRMSFVKQRVPVVLTGGLFHEGSPLIGMVQGRLSGRADVVRSEQPPVVGAVLLAHKQTGTAPGEHWEQTLSGIK